MFLVFLKSHCVAPFLDTELSFEFFYCCFILQPFGAANMLTCLVQLKCDCLNEPVQAQICTRKFKMKMISEAFLIYTRVHWRILHCSVWPSACSCSWHWRPLSLRGFPPGETDILRGASTHPSNPAPENTWDRITGEKTCWPAHVMRTCEEKFTNAKIIGDTTTGINRDDK